jgi:hypothetical protein
MIDTLEIRKRCKNLDTAVVTMGSTSQVPEFSEWGYLFAAVERMFVFQDGDRAGQKALSKWFEKYPYAEPMQSLGAGDVTDHWEKWGGDGIKDWLRESGVE